MAEPIRPKAVPPVEGAAIPLTETPEFKAAVAEAARAAAAEATAAVLAQFAANKGAEGREALPTEDAQDLLRGLALAIAEMSHQGDKRDKPVDPKVMAARREALDRMNVLIDRAKTLPKSEWPLYRCRSVLMLADTKIDPYKRDPATKKAVPVQFRWCLEPNDAMIPVCDRAKAIYEEFRASRGNKADYAKNVLTRTPWFTDKGLLIEGSPPVRRAIEMDAGGLDLDNEADPFDPNAPLVRVLGTVHPPARQYNADTPIPA